MSTNSHDEMFFHDDEVLDVFPDPNGVLAMELDDLLRRKLKGTKWEARVGALSDHTSWEERIALYQALRAEEVFPPEATYFLIAWAIEALAQDHVNETYDSLYARRFEQICRAHGLAEDETWEPGTGPLEYEALEKEFGLAADAISRATYQRFGEHQIVKLLDTDPDEANRLYEAGYEYIFRLIDRALADKDENV